MRYAGFAASTLLMMAIAFWLAGSAAAGEQVPFKGSLEGTYTSAPVDPSVPLIVFIQLDATGNATHLGKFTYDFPHVVDRTVRPSLGIGSCTFTAANGDNVFADIIGEATLIVPGLLSGVEWGMITGGTGRFAGATGSFVIERLIDNVNFKTVGSFEGTISSLGQQTQKREISSLPAESPGVARRLVT